MKTIKSVAEDLISHSGGVYGVELLDTIPEDLREACVSRETLHALVATREQKTLEFALQLPIKPSSIKEVYAALDFEKAEEMGCLAEAIRTKFYFNLAACVGVELDAQSQAEAPSTTKKGFIN